MACLLEKLSNENGVSGNEQKIRSIIEREITPYVDRVYIDTIGNLIALKHGNTPRKIMVSACMDEPGFIVSDITDKGFIKFSPVGKIDPRTIVSKRVVIGESKIKGVIGMKAIHLQKKAERENVVTTADLFVDIGAKNKKSAEKKVAPGDFFTFDTEFKELGETVKGKALNSRISCVCLAEALKQNYDSDIYAVFAAQSEIDGRGAQVAAYSINPDCAAVIDTFEPADMFGVKLHEKSAAVGKGAVVSYMDKHAIFSSDMSDKLRRLAEKNGTLIQTRQSIAGTSDGGAVQTARGGVNTVNISVPCRYSHTPVGMASKADIQSAAELITLFLKNGGEIQ